MQTQGSNQRKIAVHKHSKLVASPTIKKAKGPKACQLGCNKQIKKILDVTEDLAIAALKINKLQLKISIAKQTIIQQVEIVAKVKRGAARAVRRVHQQIEQLVQRSETYQLQTTRNHQGQRTDILQKTTRIRPLLNVTRKQHKIAECEQPIQGAGVRAQVVLAIQDEGRLRNEVLGD